MGTPAAGGIIEAAHMLRARPKVLYDTASGSLAASSNNVAIPGISISFTTETAGVELTLWWTIQADPTAAAATTLIAARPRITAPGGGTTDATVYATYGGGAATTDQATTSQTWNTTLGAAGTYTVTVLATTGANQVINVYSSLTLMVQEQWS